MTFVQWLKSQRERSDSVGTLACAVQRDRISFQGIDPEYQTAHIFNHLEAIAAHGWNYEILFKALRVARKEYLDLQLAEHQVLAQKVQELEQADGRSEEVGDTNK